MSDPFDYRDPAGLELELDLPSAPNPPRSASRVEPPPAPEPPPASEPPPEGDDAGWSLELEDIAPVAAAPSLASPPQRALAPARVAAPLAMPQPTLPLDPPAVRTLELRIAQSVDRMASFTRMALLALTIVAMLLLAVTVFMGGVRSAIQTVEQLREAREESEGSVAAPRARGAHEVQGDKPGADRYERFRVDDLVDVDDDGRHLPQH